MILYLCVGLGIVGLILLFLLIRWALRDFWKEIPGMHDLDTK